MLRVASPIVILAASMHGSIVSASDYAPLVCTEARSPPEKTVCADYALGQQEAHLATLYQWATSFVGMGERGAMQDAQKAFIARRDACGAAVQCITNAYTARIAELDLALRRIKARGPF